MLAVPCEGGGEGAPSTGACVMGACSLRTKPPFRAKNSSSFGMYCFKNKSFLVTVVLGAFLVGAALAEPPLGPRTRAICPVTGQNITISDDTPTVEFKHGQKLYFQSKLAAEAYRKDPRDFWLSPRELPLPGLDGKRGLPDLRNETLYCPNSGEEMVISMKTPRVIHRYGQNVYFCCFGCVTSFWTEPEALFA